MNLTQRVPDRLLIGGEWRDASDGREYEVINPASEDVLAKIPFASEVDIRQALEASLDGFASWSATDVWVRSNVLRRIAVLLRERIEDVALVITLEQGKPLAESRAEVLVSADYFDWFADETRRHYGRMIDGHSRANRLMVFHQPVGPVAAFTAWNFPLLLPARKLAAALAAGCSVVLKPSEETPRAALLLAQICGEAGVHPGAVNVLMGDPSQISSLLIGSGVIRKVSLTGSTAVGKTLLRLCADQVVSVSMELGGHAPVIVCADADLDLAVQASVTSKFRATGQVCTSPSRYFVAEEVADEFTQRFLDQTKQLRVGDGRDSSTQVGPVANSRRLDALTTLVDDAADQGAQVLTGGRRHPDFDRGFFFEPTVISGVRPNMAVATTEIFGPIAPILTFSDVEEAVAEANRTPYGLAGYVFTRSLSSAFAVSERLEVGLVGVNNTVIATPEAPFGGVKQSGYGREGGSEGIADYSITKYVNMRLE